MTSSSSNDISKKAVVLFDEKFPVHANAESKVEYLKNNISSPGGYKYYNR